MVEENVPDFSGKLVVIYTSSAPRAIQDGIVMEYVSFKRYGDRLFLEGRVPSIEHESLDWVSNLQAAVSWDDVTHYLIFNSHEEYLNRIGKARPPLLQRFLG